MTWIALKMLTGDCGKYLGIVFGVTFAALLITQQASIFCGLMLLTSNQIRDIGGASIWVMDSSVKFVDDVKPMSEDDLFRVRGVNGVAWAVRLFKGLSRARLGNGDFQQVSLIGLDDATLVGAPSVIVAGKLADLWKPDAVFVDIRGYHKLWPGEPIRLGRVIEMNDHRAVIVGVCRISKTFQTFPVVYARYKQALAFAPPERKMLSFILAQPAKGVSVQQACQRIRQRTGLGALSRPAFEWKTMMYYLRETGIPVNFGITVVLGFLVGSAITAQTFYLFTIENLKQFATLKALGVRNSTVAWLILLQALVVGAIGYGLARAWPRWPASSSTPPSGWPFSCRGKCC